MRRFGWLGCLLLVAPCWADTGLEGLENWDPFQQGDAPDWATPGETLVVNPGNHIAQKRKELGGALRDLGYGDMKRRGEWSVYLADPPWYPKVMVHDSGYMMIKRRGVHFKLPEVADWGGLEKPLELALCLVQPTSCIRIHGLLVSKRRLRWKEQEVVDQTRQTNGFFSGFDCRRKFGRTNCRFGGSPQLALARGHTTRDF